MSTIRTALISAAMTLVIAVAAYFALAPMTARAASSGCTASPAHVYTNADLRNMLNGRYARRVGLPY